MSESQPAVLDLRSVFGLKAIVTTPASSTGGAYVEMDVIAEPGSKTLIHYHPEQEERYEVLEGDLEVFRDGRWEHVPAGAKLTIAPREIHGFRNAGTVPVRFRNVHRPALAYQDHLETLDRLILAGAPPAVHGARRDNARGRDPSSMANPPPPPLARFRPPGSPRFPHTIRIAPVSRIVR